MGIQNTNFCYLPIADLKLFWGELGGRLDEGSIIIVERKILLAGGTPSVSYSLGRGSRLQLRIVWPCVFMQTLKLEILAYRMNHLSW
jgi:hypothetical protein